MIKNAWAVQFRDPKDKEWKTEKWYKSIIITNVDKKDLSDEQQFDLGELQASHQAKILLHNSNNFFEVQTRKVYFAGFKEKFEPITYIGAPQRS